VDPVLVGGLTVGLFILLAAGGLVLLGWHAGRAGVDEAKRRHAAELLLRDATERALRSELAAERKNATLGSAAAALVVNGAAALAGAPAGADGDRVRWGPRGAAGAGGGPPDPSGAAAGSPG
jgi:hypothetical protein